MVIDDLGTLRSGGSSPRVTATEAGSTSTTRDATTGKVLVDIKGTPLQGIPICVIADADTGTSNDKSAVVTIEAADETAFNVTNEVIATFPAITYASTVAKFMVRRIHTAKRYIRCVITLSGSNGTYSRDFLIFVGAQGVMNREA